MNAHLPLHTQHLSRFFRCIVGHAIARPLLPRMPKFAGPLGSSHTALVLVTKPINPPDNCDRRKTNSHVVTDTAGASHKSP